MDLAKISKMPERLRRKILGDKKISNILAIDPATKCGWALTNEIFGCWDLSIKKDESAGMRLIRFKSKLQEIISISPLDIIVFEGVSGISPMAVQTHSKLIGQIEVFCHENNIDFKGYKATAIKKFATGKGNANKNRMIEEACIQYGYSGNDDNEADALHLLNFAKQDLML